MKKILRFLVKTPSQAKMHSLQEWWNTHQTLCKTWQDSFAQAVIGGFFADRLGYAFASGYQSALRALVPSHSKKGIGALCVTEESGTHPARIKTSLKADESKQFVLHGKKVFASLAPVANYLFILASLGKENGGKNKLRLVCIEKDRTGISIGKLYDTPFIPEIPHGEILFQNVSVSIDEIIPGNDAYTSYIKPFRTIEDIYVYAAFLGYFFRIAKEYLWPTHTLEQLAAFLHTLYSICQQVSQNPQDPVLHIALGGFLNLSQGFLQSTKEYWDLIEKDVLERFLRDQSIFLVAESFRKKRLALAWQNFKVLP